MVRSGSPPPSELSAEELAELVGRRDKDAVKLARQVLKAIRKAEPDALPSIPDDAELSTVDAVPGLLDDAEADAEKRAAALAAVARHAPRESLTADRIGRVRKMLAGADTGEVATAAGLVLAHAGDGDFLSAQLDALALDDANARRTAAYFLGAGRFRPALQSILELLAPGNASIRSAVLWAAGEIRSSDAVPSLLGMLEQGAYVPEVCDALGKIADTSALPALLQLVQAGTPEHCAAATGAVARVVSGAKDPMITKELAGSIAGTMERVVDTPPNVTSAFFALSVLARFGIEMTPNRIRAALGSKLEGEDLTGVAAFFTSRKPTSH